MSMTSTDFAKRVLNTENEKDARRSVLKRIILLGIILAITLGLSTLVLGPLIPPAFLLYTQIAQFALIGYFVMEIISNSAFRVATVARRSNQTAKSIRSLIRILGSLIITAIIISFLSQNPALAAAIGTITAVVIGFAAQNVIGNLIAGMYLTITRPFKIDDRITVLGNSGKVIDIGLLYSGLLMDSGDTVLVPNTLLITSSIILGGRKKSDVPAPLYIW
ncbi:MAG TPA: mechanosensitive ion channel domain-containing protein [Candidatus Acidoferrum sp.]|nr:mechanosensitive ion channel domain-containing protein [Candidatus Acidoferrum sp.]